LYEKNDLKTDLTQIQFNKRWIIINIINKTDTQLCINIQSSLRNIKPVPSLPLPLGRTRHKIKPEIAITKKLININTSTKNFNLFLFI